MTMTIDLDNMSPARRELLRLRLKRGAQAAPDVRLAPVPHADRGGPLPLSWAQQRLWFLDQLDKSASHAYHMPAALRLHGSLDVPALRATLDRLVLRHEALRTRIGLRDGAPVQRIDPPGPFALLEHDLSGLDDAAQLVEATRLALEETLAPFDLERGPLIRASLLRLAPDCHQLLFTQHHIVSDGWSVGIVLREVSALYAAFSRGLPDPLAPLPLQYADYAAWQRGWLRGAELERQLGFWKQHLGGAPALLELPLDHPRPAVQGYAGASVVHILPAPLAASLRALGQRHGGTMFMTLLAAWSALLARLSGQDDLVVGTPVANRQRSELEGLVGFFVNTLALRITLDENETGAALLARAKAATLAACSHQDLPFEQVVEALRPRRSMAHHPLFQVMLSVDNTPRSGAVALPGLRVEPLTQSAATTQFDLALNVHDDGRVLECAWHYASALFEPATVRGWSRHFEILLAALAADPSLPVAALPVLDTSQRAELLALARGAGLPGAPPALMHVLFERQAARTPHAVALRDEGGEVSYAETNRRANLLARRLLATVARPDTRVAIYAERSVEMVIGLLAILKSGAAYVPLDPSYPLDRLAYMLEDSAPAAVLAQPALAARLPPLRVPLLLLEAAAEAGEASNPEPAALGLTPAHLAYVIYTSGSTGKPKGAMNQHDGSVSHLLWARDYFALAGHDRVLQKTPVGFDVSVWEIFLPLLSGVTLVMARARGHTDPAYVCAAIAQHRITVAHFVPSMLALFLDQPEAAACRSLRMVVCSGEVLPPALYRRLAQVLPGVALHNLYGPTETAVHMTAWECTPEAARRVSIGQPIPGSAVYVVDALGRLLPRGATGELYIGGTVVGRGYLHRPRLTAERYLPDPYAAEGERDARLYRSGDIGRWLPGGGLEYLGRNDFQVKLRGLRIELGEIEAGLRACEGVRDALVLARADGGEQRLVAYLLGDEDGTQVAAFALRAALSAGLPEYMVPALYVWLPAWPLTPSGKLDRLALPAPGHADLDLEAYEAPRGATETALSLLWQELLGVEAVGRRDDFFALGGHSMLAMRLHARVRAEWGGALALRDIVASPQLHAMAAAIDGRGRAGLSILVPLRAEGDGAPLFLVHSGGGEVNYGRDLLPWLPPRLPLYGLAASGHQQGETLPDSVEAMARAYVEAMCDVQPRGPYRIAGWSAGGTIACDMTRQLEQRGEQVSFLGLIDTHHAYHEGPGAGDHLLNQGQLLFEWLGGKGADAGQLAVLDALAKADRVDAMLDLAMGQGWIPPGLERGWLRRHIALRQAIVRALLAYRTPPLSATVHLFTAQDGATDPTLGWSAAGAHLSHVVIGGSHASIVTEPHVRRLALAITQGLAGGWTGEAA